MPPTILPPTPASSTDIPGQDGCKNLAALQMAFELPPPAMTASNNHAAARNASSSPTATGMPADASLMSPPMVPKNDSATLSKSSPSLYPMQAAEAVKSRRRSSAAASKAAFALPPPPTRSRKIIQMKPRTAAPTGTATEPGESPVLSAQGRSAGGAGKSGTAKSSSAAAAATAAVAGTASSAPADAGSKTTTAAGKRKQPSSTSAAGRKIARKTAHSLIERRRRSKMNEEFAVLKNMIPACTGEMHKLAILQASIEYVRYLEDCVATLKAQRESEHQQEQDKASFSVSPPARQQQYDPARPYSHGYSDGSVSPDVEMTGVSRDDDYDEDEDEEDEGDADNDAGVQEDNLPSPALTTTHARSNQSNQSNQSSPSSSSRRSSIIMHHQPSVSPALLAQDARYHQHRQDSQSSIPSMDHRHYSFSYSAASAQASPAFGPMPSYLYAPVSSAPTLPPAAMSTHSSAAGSTLTSPVLLPQRDMDQEATAALLMLNNDRRGTVSGSSGGSGNNASGRGMSVRDLLST